MKFFSYLFVFILCFLLNDSFADTLSFTENEKQYIKNSPPLRIPIMDKQPPLSFFKEKQAQGYLNDLVNEVLKRAGLKHQKISGISYAESLKALENGEVDLLNDYSVYGGERDYVLQTRAVLISPFVVVGKPSLPIIRTVKDLKNHRLVLVQGFQQTNALLNQHPDINVLLVNNIAQAYKVLRSNDADYYIDNVSHAGYYLRDHMINDLKILGELPASEMGQLRLHFATHKKQAMLHSILEKSLASMSYNDLNRLRNKWISNEKRLILSHDERQWLKKHPMIKTIVDPHWAPVEYSDEKGQFNGISIDYLRIIEEKLGIKFEVAKNQTWTEGVNKFKDKQAHLVSSMARTEEREKIAIFTKPYVSMPVSIFARKDVSYIGNLSNLKGKNIAVVDGFAVHEWLTRDNLGFQVIAVKTPEIGLQLVSKGKVDVFVGNVVPATYYLGKLNISNIRVAGDTPYQYQQTMAVRNDWPILANILQKALDTITTEQHEKIFNRWMSLRFEYGVNYQLIWIISLIAFLMIAIIFYWNRLLDKKVRLRTQELSNSNNQLAEERNRANELAIEAKASSQAKSLFLANMSHEIRTPLNGVLGIGQLLYDTPLNEEQKALLKTMTDSGNSLLHVINDILDFSKIESGMLVLEDIEFNMAEVIHHVIQLLKHSADEKNLSIDYQTKEKICSVMGDKIRLIQILSNLMGNAIKFTETGGVTINTEVIQQTADWVEFTVSITDSGIGISKHQVKRIFEEFSQADDSTTRKYGGTGLGLSISKKLLKLMGSQLKVDSEPGKGSCFYFTLTLNKSKFKDKQYRSIDKLTKQKFGNILLVEDDKVNQMVAKKIFKKLNCDITIVNNGQEALEKLKGETFDLVFMDIQMPILDGIKATEIIRKKDKNTIIIAMTANVMEEDKQNCLNAGMNDYLAKPVKIEELTHKLNKWLS